MKIAIPILRIADRLTLRSGAHSRDKSFNHVVQWILLKSGFQSAECTFIDGDVVRKAAPIARLPGIRSPGYRI